MNCVRCCKLWSRIKVFFGGKRSLCGAWTVEEITELNAMHGLDVEQELADILREEINKELVKEYGPDWQRKQDEEIVAALRKHAEEIKNEQNDNII